MIKSDIKFKNDNDYKSDCETNVEISGDTLGLTAELANLIMIYLYKINPVDTTVRPLTNKDFMKRLLPIFTMVEYMANTDEVREGYKDISGVNINYNVWNMIKQQTDTNLDN